MKASLVSRSLQVALAVLLAASWIGAGETPSSEPEGELWSAEAYKNSRIYRAGSEDVWEAVRETLAELRIKIEHEDEATGVLVTRRKSLKKLFAEKVELSDGWVGDHVTLYIMVPRFAEPGRVYLSSVIHARYPDDLRGPRDLLNHDSVASWLFPDIDARLGVEGVPIPATFAGRRAFAREWLGEVPPGSCLARDDETFLLVDPTGVQHPQRIPASYLMPEFGPSSKPGKVFLQVNLNEDGVVEGVTVLRSTQPAWKNSAMAAVMRWRYEPARLEGCPVPEVTTVIVDYTG